MKHLPIFLLGLFLGMGIVALLTERSSAVEEIILVRDTIETFRPKAHDSAVVRYAEVPVRTGMKGKKYAEPKHLDNDAAYNPCDTEQADTIFIPIMQKHYVDTAYEAWVSGYDAQLDSMCIFRQSIVMPQRRKRWHIGMSVGFAATPHGASPYIGIGITYSFFSF